MNSNIEMINGPYLTKKFQFFEMDEEGKIPI